MTTYHPIFDDDLREEINRLNAEYGEQVRRLPILVTERVRLPCIGATMEALYDLPNGDRVRVIDTTTVGQSLGRVLELFRSGETEPVFFGDEPRPEGVVISFGQWAEYATLKEDAEDDRRREELVRQRLADADDLSKWETYEEMMKRYGLDPDSAELKPKGSGAHDDDGKP